jgi:phenylalanyl-tRNA synthetase beta chain
VFVGDQVAVGVGQHAQPATYATAIQAARVAAHAVGAELSVRQTSAAGFHPGRAAELLVATDAGDTIVGIAGELHPELTAANDLPRRVAALELRLDALFAAAPSVVSAGPVYIYPAATQDLSLVVDATVPAAEVQAAVAEGAGELLEAIALTDDYRGAGIEDGKKSLTFALRFRASDRTLTQVEASESRDAAVALTNQRFGAQIRS